MRPSAVFDFTAIGGGGKVCDSFVEQAYVIFEHAYASITFTAQPTTMLVGIMSVIPVGCRLFVA